MSGCPRCGGPVFEEYGDLVCLNCGWRKVGVELAFMAMMPPPRGGRTEARHCPKCSADPRSFKHRRECMRKPVEAVV